MTADPMTPREFFADSPAGWALFERVAAVIDTLPVVQVRVSKSQISFRGRRGFAYVWRPGRYVRSGVPAVLSIALDRQLDSPRFKQVVHPSPQVWMHHLELRHTAEVDSEVADWLRQAYESAD